MKYKVVSKQPSATDCFICGKNNPSGVHADFYDLECEKIACVFTARSIHEGHPGILHGGIICSILDETAGRSMTVVRPEIGAFTVQLDTTYKKPVPSNTRLVALGWVEEVREKVYISKAQIYLEDGSVAAEAKGVYYIIKDIPEGSSGYHQVFPCEQDLFEIDIPDHEDQES